MRAATMFAAAAHALEGHNDSLAARALKQSKRLMKEAEKLLSTAYRIWAEQCAYRTGRHSCYQFAALYRYSGKGIFGCI